MFPTLDEIHGVTYHFRSYWTSVCDCEFVRMNACMCVLNYRQVSNISRTLLVNKIVDYSDVVGASPVGAAPTTSSFST